MDLPEARLIARHHLGDRLHWIGRGGPHADLWVVQAWPDTGHMMSAQGATVDAAAADCAAQLRAAGWVPTHARLEWIPCEEGAFRLLLRVGKIQDGLLDLVRTDLGWIVCCYAQPDDDTTPNPLDTITAPLAEVQAAISAWVAENLPYHLPPFPGDKP